jgi:hypothetical protein
MVIDLQRWSRPSRALSAGTPNIDLKLVWL